MMTLTLNLAQMSVAVGPTYKVHDAGVWEIVMQVL